MLLKTVLAIFLLAPSSYPQSGSKSWYQVLEVKGTASKQTDLFETKGTKWRIRWQKTNPKDQLSIYVFAKDGSPESAIATQSEGADESYIHKSGTFYLNISASTAYTIVVEDWR
jgi:hypothetical protein